ncbi:hypothetical protein CF319_g7025 [Tilletia indica]|nr:hypothetical protein CF319_g7025 [Tilletia indica]
MGKVEDAEQALSVAIRNLKDVAHAAGYKPEWVILLKKLGVDMANERTEDKLGVDLANERTEDLPPAKGPPGWERFECVSIPATSLLLAGPTSGNETWARPGRKPTPRQENKPSTKVIKTQPRPKIRKTVRIKDPSHHPRCKRCMTDRSSGGWRSSVLGRVTPRLCLKCYGREFRRIKKERYR